jgi:CPA2 family monovalent cation:H+ antiporter-2
VQASDGGQLHAVLILLLAAIVAVPLAQRLRAPPMLGYLAAGLAVGPFGLGLVENTAEAEQLSPFGVVFLLFTIGLDLPLARLQAMWRYIFGLGMVQMIVTAALVAAIAYALGADIRAALVIGSALAFSSTAAVVQLLAERGELASRAGRIAIAVLLLQDLSVVPLLALLPLLRPGGGGIVAALAIALGKGAAALILILLLGRLVLRPLFRLVARTRIAETFAATVLLVVLGTGWATAQAGMSMALGAFLAGLLLAETEYRHQVEVDIQPFRGLFLGLFFITVGMVIDIPVLVGHWVAVLVIAGALLALKSLLLAVLARLFGLVWPLAVRTALLLSQGGEFAFVVFAMAMALSPPILGHDTGEVLIAAVTLTMATTPAMAALGRHAAARLQATPAPESQRMSEETEDISGHVVIAGYGRVGQIVGQLLAAQQIPYVAIEQDVALVEAHRRHDRPVYFGDASRPELLEAAGLRRASGAVITLNQPAAAERLVAALRRAHPTLHIIARSHDVEQQRRLQEAGADAVILEALEPGLQMGAAVLRGTGAPSDAVDHALEAFRRSNQ